MSIIKSLNLSTVEAPKNTRNTVSTLERAKGKFSANLATQIKAAEAFASGQSSYSISKKRYVTDDATGERRRVAVDVDVRPWWFEQDGQFFVTVRYANKPLELAKGKPSIAAGETLESVRDVLEQIRDAVDAGEMDKLLEATATEARKRMSGK